MFTLEPIIQNIDSAPGSGMVLMNDTPLSDVVRFDPGLRRPYYDRGQVWVDVTRGYAPLKNRDESPVLNADGTPKYVRVTEPELVTERVRKGLPVLQVDNTTVLPRDAWVRLDAAVRESLRGRLRAWSDLRSVSTLGGFDAMSYPILERELIRDVGEAKVDMDGLSEDTNLQPDYGLQGLPLPLTHSGFFMSDRFLQSSRAAGRPADTQRAEMAGRRVGEMIEKMTIGNAGGSFTYGTAPHGSYLRTSAVYGYRDHPAVITKTDLGTSATLATNVTTNAATIGGTAFVNDVLEMIDLAYGKNLFGPFMLYVSTGYDTYLNHDFKANSDLTIRGRIREIDTILDVRRLDYLTGDELLLVQMTPENVQAINGLEPTLVQWDTKGGMQRNFKVLAIQVPYIKSAYLTPVTGPNTGTEVAGIVYGTTS